MSYNNKFDLDINYRYKIDLEDNPLYSLNQFNVNTVFYMIERVCGKVFKEGRKNPTYFYNRKKGKMDGDRYYVKLSIRRWEYETKPHIYEKRWFGELLVWDNYWDYKDGLLNKTTQRNGLNEWDLLTLMEVIFDRCRKWDKDVFEKTKDEVFKYIIDKFNIQTFEELQSKFKFSSDNLHYYEDEVRKQKWKKNEEVDKLWKEIHKQ